MGTLLDRYNIEADGYAPTVKPATVGESGGGRLYIGH